MLKEEKVKKQRSGSLFFSDDHCSFELFTSRENPFLFTQDNVESDNLLGGLADILEGSPAIADAAISALNPGN